MIPAPSRERGHRENSVWAPSLNFRQMRQRGGWEALLAQRKQWEPF
jgi:hypothetical protein